MYYLNFFVPLAFLAHYWLLFSALVIFCFIYFFIYFYGFPGLFGTERSLNHLLTIKITWTKYNVWGPGHRSVHLNISRSIACRAFFTQSQHSISMRETFTNSIPGVTVHGRAPLSGQIDFFFIVRWAVIIFAQVQQHIFQAELLHLLHLVFNQI